MLKSITLKFTESPPLSVAAEGVTIFVGPNNSGKSLLLREVEQSIENVNFQGRLLADFDLVWPADVELNQFINTAVANRNSNLSNEFGGVTRFTSNGQYERGDIHIFGLRNSFQNRNARAFAAMYAKLSQIRLDGRTRFALTDDRTSGDLVAHPPNIFAHLFQKDELRAKVRDVIYNAIGSYFVVDPTNVGQLRIRLSSTPPTHDEQSLSAAAREFHGKALYIKDASDGIQAFVGIIVAILAGNYRCILIDEPEAFLHPPLARKLGYELASAAIKANGTLMASTHSSDFLMGCLHASPNVRVVRLEYSSGKSKGQIVDSEQLRKFVKKPLIRSTNVISALFHDGVVVTESDNDRAFYSEIYYRLAEQEKGYPSLLFVNAQNKQTIKDIVGPLRAFGVPAAAIPDIDILKDGGATWVGWLEAGQVPNAIRNGLGQVRGDLYKRFTETGVDMKVKGIAGLNAADAAAANELFDTLDRYGVFVTRNGELENWLKALSISGKKTDWTIGALERMGSDPSDSNYLKPASGDVWDFMRGIVQWIKNPARKGTS